ncbi:MAG TPA: hypothetical protein VIK07_00005, partial [Bacteroidales bacterium]
LEYGKHGILFENNNYEELALRIEQAIHFYETGEIVKIISSAYNHCLINFNITGTAQKYCETYL